MTNKKYDIQYTNKFKKQYHKIKQQQHFKQEEFEKVVKILSTNEILPTKYRNHLLNPKSERSVGMSYSTRYITRISKI